jgi:nucleoside-triphosphatase THEP1
MFILLTGPQGAGKTTACWKALPGLRSAGVKIAGFISPPLLDAAGAKTGIQMVDLTTGQSHTFAKIVGPQEPADIGVYRLDENALTWARNILAAALLANMDWLVIDEIGPLELRHQGGFAFALDALADPERVPNAIVIVREYLVDDLAARLGRADLIRVHVTANNRAEIPGRLVKLILETQAQNT